MASEFTCPNCGNVARSTKELAPDTAVRCRKCEEVFRVPTADSPIASNPPGESEERAQRRVVANEREDDRPVKSRRRPVDEPAPRRSRRSRRHDDDEDEHSRRQKKSGAVLAIVLGGSAFAVLVLIVGIVLIVNYFDDQDSPKQPVAYGQGPIIPPPGFFAPPGAAPAPPPPDAQLSDTRPLIGPPAKAVGKTNPPPVHADGQLPRDILDRVKKATVYVRVTMPDGKMASGSGFIAGSKDLIMTNAHVVGMLQPENPPPRKIDVVLNSGETGEATFKGEVLSVDRVSDLAVVRIAGAGAIARPEPLAVSASVPLETQQVFIFGFPLGENLGKNITVAKSSVSSLRPGADGMLDQIQVNGGMHHGNSGGPVVDGAGQLLGVSVAGIDGTQISFAVPADRVRGILSGRLTTITTGETEQKGDQLVVPIDVAALDPLGRVQDLKLDWWWGDAAMKVPAAIGTAPNLTGAQRTSISLRKKGLDQYSTELALPRAIPADKTLWLQVNYTTSAGRIYMQGVDKEIDPPPETRSVNLTFRPEIDSTVVDMKSINRINGGTAKGSAISVQLKIDALLSERINQLVPGRNASVEVGFTKFDLDVSANNKTVTDEQLTQAAKSIQGNAAIDFTLDAKGNMSPGKPNMSAVPAEHHRVVEGLTTQVAHSMNFGSIPFPNGQVDVGQTWHGVKQLPIRTLAENFFYNVNVTYTYKGVRTVNGREMAVIALAGRSDNGGGFGAGVSGTAVGKVLVDVAAGRVAKAHVVVLSTMQAQILTDESEPRLESSQIRSHLDVHWTRR